MVGKEAIIGAVRNPVSMGHMVLISLGAVADLWAAWGWGSRLRADVVLRSPTQHE